MSEHIVKAPHVPPFVTFVTSTVPMVFDNSLSYYEALCALWKWLQDDVVNVINNNATVTEDYINLTNEYTQKFIELKEYVDTYFDNLDVQEEINNKLDAMVEDGTLQQLIASYLQTQIIYDTTEAMIADAEHLVNGVRVETLGYHSVDDGGASFFLIKNTGTADGYTVIDLENGLYAHMIYLGNSVRPEQFGAYGDGVNDHNDSDAIQYAINSGKTVEFSPKTYMCYGLTATSPVTIHGNGATLKRPELDIAPYNFTVDEMKWTKTLTVSADINIANVNFDNNCFTMWSLSDGYAQEQSCALFLHNASTKFTAFVDRCTFKNSAGDGIMIFNNCKAFISNCESTETFRGGLTMTGTSEINVDGWISNSITLPDGFDVEMASGAAVGKFILNMNNIVVDHDLDLGIPANGECKITNLVMRQFDLATKTGFIATVAGYLQISNSVLRFGTPSNYNINLTTSGKIDINDCDIIGNTTSAIFNILPQTSDGSIALNFNNCKIKCYDCLMLGVYDGTVKMNDCDIVCSNNFLVQRGNAAPQPKHLYISNCNITNGGDKVIYLSQTQYVTFADGVNLYLFNVNFKGTGVVHWTGTPTIHYNNLVMEACYNTTFTGYNEVFKGDRRLVIVPQISDLTTRSWIYGNDVALDISTGKYYKNTAGTTWVEIS